jgi:Tfp pilus assembly protein PilV
LSRGFVLVEVTIAYVILIVALVALVPVFIMAIRAGTKMEQLQTATYLSEELLEEVRMRRWDELTAASLAYIPIPSALGVDAGETAGIKTTFDDIDDFNGYTEAGVLDPMGNALPDFKSYTRTVTVAYVDANLNVSVPVTDYKKITVCTKTAKTAPSCLNTVLTNR